jgi:glycosyltransferase involved in cell wall biosynthesis
MTVMVMAPRVTVSPLPAPGRIDVCIVSPFAYAALTGGEGGQIGGVEHQTSLMARWLAARGHRVNLITWDEGQPEGVEVDGVRVVKLCRRDAGLPGLRFIHPRWSSLNAALHRADARVYYQNSAEYVTGQVALWSRRHGRRFVYSVASNMDCEPSLPELRTLRERILYRYGLRRADRVIVQTRTQQRMLLEGFGRPSVMVPMPCPGPGRQDFAPPEPSPSGSGRVLWLGRICEVKRPDRLLALAEACPEIRFDLVGPADDGAYCRAILERARRITNVTVHGPSPRESVPDLYARAACLCNTSVYEGFPNTFLEAWSHGRPVVSTIDPDGLIAGRGLGAVGADVAGLAAGIRELLTSPERWRAASANARRYYLDNHTVERTMTLFESVLAGVMDVSRPMLERGPSAWEGRR